MREVTVRKPMETAEVSWVIIDKGTVSEWEIFNHYNS